MTNSPTNPAGDLVTDPHFNIGCLYGIADAVAVTDPSRAGDMRLCLSRITQALLSSQDAAGDFATVPREPTAAMLDAGRILGWDDPEHEGSCVGHPETRADIYRAMVAAAPALAASPAHATGAAMREVGPQGMTMEEAEALIEQMRLTIHEYEERERRAALSSPAPEGEAAQGVEPGSDDDAIAYYVECLEAVAFRRHPVRDLAEAEGAYKAAMARRAPPSVKQ